MKTARVRAEFDLTITDDEAARRCAVDVMRGITNENAAAGGSVVTDGASPEVTMHGLAQQDPLVQSVVVKEILGHGVGQLSFATLSNLNIEHLPLAPS